MSFSPSFFEHLQDRLELAVYDTNQEIRALSPIDRIKDKLKTASGVAQRVATQIEAEADALIAREDQLKSKTAQAFAPHKAIMDQATNELDQVEAALNLMSNGGPSLDPLPESAPAAKPSSVGPYPSYP